MQYSGVRLLAMRMLICKRTPITREIIKQTKPCPIVYSNMLKVFVCISIFISNCQACRGKGISIPIPIPFPQDFCGNPHVDPHMDIRMGIHMWIPKGKILFPFPSHPHGNPGNCPINQYWVFRAKVEFLHICPMT